MGDKKFPTEWVFFELVSPPTSYTVISNPQPYFSRVLSFNEDSKHLLHTTWILNISIVSQNTVSKKASGYWPQFYVAGPNVFLLTTAISSNTAAVSEMACSWLVCGAFTCFNSSFIPCFMSAFSGSKDSLPSLLN